MENQKIAILIDSSAYLPEEITSKYDIHVIPLLVNWGDESVLDNIDITPEQFYQKLKAAKDLPTTSQPSAGQFKEKFESLAKVYTGVVAILISEHLSGTIASTKAAAAMVGDFPIEIVDSRSTTLGLGLIALAAARARDGGANIKEIASVANDIVEKMRVIFVVDTLEFLHKGGRIGGAQRLVGSVLAIKPILNLVDGRIDSLESVRTKKKAVQTMMALYGDDIRNHTGIHVGVFHGSAEEEAKKLIDQVSEENSPDTVIIGKLSPAIGVHTGPGTLGIAYYFD